MAKINQLRWNDARQKLPTAAGNYIATYEVRGFDKPAYTTAIAYFNPGSGWDKDSTWAHVVAWTDMPEPWTPRKGSVNRAKIKA